jgi:phosphoglycerate dehydrogenase-like enzyme
MADTISTPRGVLITAPIETSWLERLQKLSSALEIHQWLPSAEGRGPDDLWQQVEILYTSFATRLPPPEHAPRLRWVQLYSAGPDPLFNDPLFSSPVVFTTTSGIHAINMAEYIFTMLLAWFHRLPSIFKCQQQGQWPSSTERSSLFVGEELWGKSIAIVGYGSIGRQVARLAKTFGMQVLAMQQGTDHRDNGFQFPGIGDPEGIFPDYYYPPEQLHSMLRESDIVVVAVPLTPKTRGMFNETAFRAMKPTAFLVNLARGDVCDEADLVRALSEKQIAGAALDVFHTEPLPSNHPLWYLDNVFISPHTAGLTPHYSNRAAILFEENLRRYLSGDPLYNVVDKERGY